MSDRVRPNPVVTSRLHGFSAGVPGTGAGGGKRGQIRGWSQGALRRNLAWLQSVDVDRLDLASAWTVTLTLPWAPATADAFHEVRRAVFRQWKKQGVEDFHWIVEWTRRGVPHIHLFVVGGDPGVVVFEWVRQWARRTVDLSWDAQHFAPVTEPLGWLQYVAKHGARGVYHYQRAGAPAGWEKTGRLWGHSGWWPIVPDEKLEMTHHEFHRFRREVVKAAAANAKRRGDYRQAKRLASTLSSGSMQVSRVKGVGGWLSRDTQEKILEWILG